MSHPYSLAREPRMPYFLISAGIVAANPLQLAHLSVLMAGSYCEQRTLPLSADAASYVAWTAATGRLIRVDTDGTVRST